MYTLASIIHFIFPLIALILLMIGIKRNAIYYVISALWLSLIALIIHYEASGGQLLGDAFNYLNAATYSINLLILIIALIRVISHLSIDHVLFRSLSSLVKAALVIGCFLVITNVWVNAYFIENRMPGTPIMQVATFNKTEYCAYRYVFYKVN
ncbi:MAG: type I secretion system protein LssZ, partial [Legionella sp.]